MLTTLLPLGLLLQAALAWDMDQSQQQGMNMANMQSNMINNMQNNMQAQQQIQVLEQKNQMMEKMMMMMMFEKMKHMQGWGKNQPSKLQVFQQNATYQEAVDRCWVANGVLARPASPELLKEMLQAIQEAGGPQGFGYWIGLKASQPASNTYVWNNGDYLSGWSNWYPGQPNNHDGKAQDCVEMRLMEGRGTGAPNDFDGWNDQDCDDTRPFVCQVQEFRAVQRCQGFADVVFVLDSSGSIGKENFAKQLKFVGNVADRFELTNSNRTGYQVSIVTYSASVKEEFPLNRFQDDTEMKLAITKIRYMASSTNTHKALEYVREESFLGTRGARPGAIKIVIVITDGKSARPADTKAMAEKLQAKGMMVMAIGIGDSVDQRELQDIASSDRNVFRAASVDVLDTIRDAVENRACTITFERGGAIMEGATEEQKAAYQKVVEEQKRLDEERKYQQQILNKIEDFGNNNNKEKVEYEEKEHEEEEKDKLEFMQASIKTAMRELDHYHELDYIKMEMYHELLYTVTKQMIRFCPLTSEATSDVMKFIGHGDSSWTPGDQNECNVEDMPQINQSEDPMVIAQRLVDMTKTDQIKMFFSGIKDSVCGSLTGYLRQVNTWRQQYPQFGALI